MMSFFQLRNGVSKCEDETRLTIGSSSSATLDVGASRHRGDGATSSESPELSGLDTMDTSRPMSEASSVWDEAESQLEVKRRQNMLVKVTTNPHF